MIIDKEYEIDGTVYSYQELDGGTIKAAVSGNAEAMKELTDFYYTQLHAMFEANPGDTEGQEFSRKIWPEYMEIFQKLVRSYPLDNENPFLDVDKLVLQAFDILQFRTVDSVMDSADDEVFYDYRENDCDFCGFDQ